MNEKKISFIICVNSEIFFEECCFYLNRLIVPEGYEAEVQMLQGAESMCSAYNQAMSATDAKYKVFMHQDVFIVYENFIPDLLAIFEADKQIGMVGMVGCEKLPEDVIMWHSRRCGNVYGSDIPLEDIPIREYRYSLQEDGYTEVEAVDGLLIAVNDEIPWREDLFDGWDFYDVSQSFEYRKQGKKVVVPVQRRPWCIHNDGILNLYNYEKYRKIFLQEYGALGAK